MGASTAIEIRPDVAPPRSGAGPLEVDDLAHLMRSVEATTRRLQLTHVTLQKEVGRLQGELAEANAQLRRSRALAALGEMAAGIAHEIRNPLGAIQLNVQLLTEDLAGAPEQHRLCDKIDRAVRSIDGIVRDVLAFARETRLQPVRVTAGALIDRVLADAESLLEGVAVVRGDAGSEGLALEVDECLVAQAAGNLVRNAIEAMRETDRAPRLEVRATRRRLRDPDGAMRERIVIAVADNGPGLPPEVVERMFNPFFTTRATGTGLGLAIVHRIVDAHDGHVQVRRSDDGGACVELCLPPAPPADGSPRSTPEVP